MQNQHESQAEQEKKEQDSEKLTMGVRYQLLQAGRQQRSNNLQYDSSEDDDVQACQSSKSGLIVVILLFLGFVMYLPFFPFSSNRRKYLCKRKNEHKN